ncbi:MltG/YceG/YrrL family protein [Alkaliphilus serpentinus]|uniref:Endolytic transglycosylase MltG n=1 Tax=Alkaliphilus serpentinus TaxID=1482731 RepID=A0A833M6U6_9FIRM|nr:hypothetical protein [Alkaliphilus serpentinus]KAB3525447.1 endolytic transglycosylase MltG [Alkaliphilus serpentinus]
MEKLRDWLHDTTDILLALIIVVVMSGVVFLNLGDWFEVGPTVTAAEYPQTVTTNPNDDASNPEEDPIIGDAVEIVEETPEAEGETDEEAADANQPEEEQQQEESTPPVTVVEVKRITIPDGTFGAGIANILKENGLIENPTEFVRTAENMNLATRLNSGTFDIPTDSSLEEIVRIIARVSN